MSSFANLYMRSHASLTREDLIPISEIFDEEKRKYYQEIMGINRFPSEYEVKRCVEYLERDINDFYFTNKTLTVFHYFKSPVSADIHHFDIDYMRDFFVKERIEQMEEAVKEAFETNKYNSIFYLNDKPFRLIVFEDLFDQIPDNQKYEIFKEIYTSAEYGFKEIDKNFFEEIISYRDKNRIAEYIQRHLRKYIDKDGMVIIYRGQENLSSSIEQSYSWSVDINTAVFFATRYTLEGQIYKAKVHYKDIIDYYTNRGESEVIVLPSSLVDIEEVPTVDTKELLKDIKSSNEIYLYHEFKEKIKPELFFHPEGIHGVGHVTRVLFLTLTLCHHYKDTLSNDDIELMCYAAVYHDIGRINDGIDKDHGFNSFKKMKQLELTPYFTDTEEYNVLRFIIENHNLGDRRAYENLHKYNIFNKEKAIYFYKIVCDADNNDRVRLRDVNPKYLRLDYSKELLLYAYHMLLNLK